MFKPKYSITPKMLKDITEIGQIKAIVERSRVLPLNEAQLRRQALVRMTHTSTSIEGNKLAEYQVDKVLSGMAVNADDKSIREVKNYQEALKEVEKLSETRKTLTLETVLSLHAIVMKGLLEDKKTGHFRPGTIYVVDDFGDGTERVRYQGPDPKKVPYLLNEFLKWLKAADEEELSPVIKAGIFHLQFVRIHPFSDGNGRVARLLTQYILYREGWDFRKIIVLEDYYNRDRLSYYNAETIDKKYQEGSDFTPWLEYFIEGYLVEARKVAELIQSIGYGRVSEVNEQVFLDRDEIKIMDFLTTTGQLTSQDIVDILGVAKRTAQLKLRDLIDKGLIKPEGKGPSTYYILA